MIGRIASACPSERHGWKSEVHGIFSDIEFGMRGTKASEKSIEKNIETH